MLITSSIFSGFGSALIWIANGEYITLCGTDENKGFYFGYLWAWNQLAEVVGNLVGAFIIDKTKGPQFYFILSIAGLVSSSGFFFLRMPSKIV